MDVSKLIHLKPEEEVLMVVHQSLIPLWPKFLLSFVWLVLPFFLLYPLFQLKTPGIILFLVLLASGLYYAARTFLMWHRSVFVVTDRRLIDVDRRGLFVRVVSEAPYRQVQDVSYSINGLWATIFRYGTLVVEISSNGVNLEVFNVYKPSAVHDLIHDLREEHGQSNVLHPQDA